MPYFPTYNALFLQKPAARNWSAHYKWGCLNFCQMQVKVTAWSLQWAGQRAAHLLGCCYSVTKRKDLFSLHSASQKQGTYLGACCMGDNAVVPSKHPWFCGTAHRIRLYIAQWKNQAIPTHTTTTFGSNLHTQSLKGIFPFLTDWTSHKIAIRSFGSGLLPSLLLARSFLS